MGAGMRGFANIRGALEMSGDDFILVVSNAGTRQQVTFRLGGKMPRAFRRHMGQPVHGHRGGPQGIGLGRHGRGRVGGASSRRMPGAVLRETLEMIEVDGVPDDGVPLEVRINQGLAVRIAERAGYTWAVEPTVAKRVGLREANFQPSSSGPGTREFFFTPRNPGQYDVDFFLAKVFAPAQVSKTVRLTLSVRA